MTDKLCSIKYDKAKSTLQLLDQRLLPHKVEYIKINNIQDGYNAISSMVVRGAPAIALAGCFTLLIDMNNIGSRNDFFKHIDYLISSRPTAVQLCNNLNSIKALINENNDIESIKTIITKYCDNLLSNETTINMKISENALLAIKSIKKNKLSVLTHCNAGPLATGTIIGTALGAIKCLFDNNKLHHAYCTETRPWNQGSRLTAFELLNMNIPSTLITDSCVSYLLSHGMVDVIFVGADRIALNGDTANKIGTLNLAVISNFYKVPFFFCAPLSTIDRSLNSGESIPIEKRKPEEITHWNGIRVAAEGIDALNPSFDVTPAELINGILTEKGIIWNENGVIDVKKFIQ